MGEQAQGTLGGLVILAVIVVVLYNVFSKDTNKSQKPVGPVAARIIGKELVTAYLKAPRTAKFEIRSVSEGVVGYSFTIVGVVHAQNSFGALIASQFGISMVWRCGKRYDEWQAHGCWEITGLVIGGQVYVAETPGKN